MAADGRGSNHVCPNRNGDRAGLGRNFKQRFPSWLLGVFVVALLAANTINIAADLAGMADAAEMLSGINSHLFVVGFALLISWATVQLRYHQIANVLKWLVLVLFAYPITAFVVGADWGRVLRDTLVPSIPHTRNEWSMLVAHSRHYDQSVFVFLAGE